jgi:hypothetical protein
LAVIPNIVTLRGTHVEDTGWCEPGESSLELKSTVGHGKALHVLLLSRPALKKFTSSPPSERTKKKIWNAGPAHAGRFGKAGWQLCCLTHCETTDDSGYDAGRIRCCAVTTLAYGLAPR